MAKTVLSEKWWAIFPEEIILLERRYKEEPVGDAFRRQFQKWDVRLDVVSDKVVVRNTDNLIVAILDHGEEKDILADLDANAYPKIEGELHGI